MTSWQRPVRLLIAVFGVVFAVFLVRQFKPSRATLVPAQVVSTDPGAIIEMTGCRLQRVTLSHEDVSIECDKQLTYADGTTRLLGVTLTFTEKNGGGLFSASGKEAVVSKDQSTIVLNGNVRLASSSIRAGTEHATFTKADNTVRAPGPVELTEGRTTVSGVGFTFDRDRDVLSVLDQAVVRVAPEDQGGDATGIRSGTATFARREHYRRFEHGVRIERGDQVIESETALARFRDDGERLAMFELRGGARIATAHAAVGALQALTGQDVDLYYGEDGRSLVQALVTGDAAIGIAGAQDRPGRRITAQSLDIAVGPDGSTPVGLAAREAVQLVFPPEPGVAGRTITSTNLDARGEPGRGLSRARFTGNVRYRERGGAVNREAAAGALDVGLTPGLAGFDDARFSGAVKFEEGKMAALAAVALYDVEKGTLGLSGTEPGALTPHVVTDQLAVDASRIDLTLEGPLVKASGKVKSELRPARDRAPGATGNDVKMPTMLKQDLPVIVVADDLEYDGPRARSTYTGAARLFQGDTTVKGDTIVVDGKKGDLSASGGVTTTTVLQQAAKGKGKQQSHSVATATDLQYDDAARRITYTGGAHLSGSEGDMTADRIELYLKPSGDELDRAEAYDTVTLREQRRKTTGSRMTYLTDEEKYIVTGSPVAIVDECGRETVGRTLTFLKATDSILVDGNARIRTQTKGGGGKCPG